MQTPSIDSKESISHSQQVKYIHTEITFVAREWNAGSEQRAYVIGMEAKPDIIYELIAYARKRRAQQPLG